MGDAESFQPSKKRAAGVQLSRDNPGLDDDEEISEPEGGTFKRASEDVLATRRIVKVRRSQTSTPAAAAPSPASNPFASIRLVPPPSATPPVVVEPHGGKSNETEIIDGSKSENKVDEPKDESTAENEKADATDANAEEPESKIDDSKAKPNAQNDETNDVGEIDTSKNVAGEVADGGSSGNGVKKDTEADSSEIEAKTDVEDKGNNEEKECDEPTAEKNAEMSSLNSFQQLSSNQNAFSGFSATGFSSSVFSFGSIPKDGAPTGSGTATLFGLKSDNPTFGFGVNNNGNSSIFGTSGASIVSQSEANKIPPMQEVPVETGEENEKAVFTADSVLFEFIDGGWKERGKGELKVNVSTIGTGKARLVMRAKGNYRLILNASLFPDMKLTNMDKKGITFACINSAGEGKDGLSTIALKFREASIVEDFRAAVMEHKEANNKANATLKTPENSP